MKIYFGNYSYYLHLIPVVKVIGERARWNKKLVYFSLEFGWLKWWLEIELINSHDKA